MMARAQAPSGSVRADQMQIGEVAERVGLSIRTIRHYEEVGLVVPSARSEGGFRLYVESDLARLTVVKQMKPLGFTLEQMREVLGVLDSLALDSARSTKRKAATDRAALLERLAMFHQAAQQRVVALEDELAAARSFADGLRVEIDTHRPT